MSRTSTERRSSALAIGLVVGLVALLALGYFVFTRPQMKLSHVSGYSITYRTEDVAAADAQRLQQSFDNGEFAAEYCRRVDAAGIREAAEHIRAQGFSKLILTTPSESFPFYNVSVGIPEFELYHFDVFRWQNVAPLDPGIEAQPERQLAIFEEMIEETLHAQPAMPEDTPLKDPASSDIPHFGSLPSGN